MSFWGNVKTGFSYGLGGGFGWTLGQALARWLLKLAKLAIIAVTVGSVGMCSMHDLAKTSQNQPPAQSKTQQGRAAK